MSSTILGKRHLPRRELQWVGKLLDQFNYSHFPTKMVVLRRVLFQLELNPRESLLTVGHLVHNELKLLWENAGYGDILRHPSHILKDIYNLHASYKKLLQVPTKRRTTSSFLQKVDAFRGKGSELFDMAVASLKTSNRITKEDSDFLLYHWTKTISTTKDTLTQAAVEKKLARAEKRKRFASNQSASSPLPTTSTEPSSSPPTTSTAHLDSSLSPPDNSADFTPKRPRTSTLSGTSLHFPSNILEVITPIADRIGISDNQLVALTAGFVNHCGGNIDNIALSKSTARRHRVTARGVGASLVKDNFDRTILGQINFDGKLLKELGGFGKVHRLAVTLVREDEDHILCIAKTLDGTGKTEAQTVKAALDDWGVTDKIVACGFDTTSSNTGKFAGACVILQQLLDRQILWLPCRHHILELIVGAAFTEIFGDTTGPEVTLFKVLKTSWSSLNLDDLQIPDIPKPYQDDVPSLLAFINHWLEPENVELLPRGDYKQFLELGKIFLGGSLERKKGWEYHIQRPGADHHARWMSKSIYIIKFRLLMHQFSQYDLHWQTRRKIEKMSYFVVFAYLRSWFQSPSLSGAANNDLLLYKELQKFKKIHPKTSAATSKVIRRHTWYLTEELIPLALFDISLPEETRAELARKIGELTMPVDFEIRKPSLPAITLSSTVCDFVGPRSTLMFDLLEVPHTFLLEPDWLQRPESAAMQMSLRHLIPLNDSAERALALATTINGNMTRTEETYQELVLVIAAHRKKYNLKTKKDLKMLR